MERFDQIPGNQPSIASRLNHQTSGLVTVLRRSPERFKLETRNNRDFGDALIRAVFDEVSGAI
jgi:hypothetical protein